MAQKIFFILICPVLLMGCAGASQQTVTEITVEATDFTYDPVSITIPAGQPVTLTLKNTGEVEHDFLIDNINVANVEASDSGPAEHHHMNQPEYDLHFFAKAGETAVCSLPLWNPESMKSFAPLRDTRKQE